MGMNGIYNHYGKTEPKNEMFAPFAGTAGDSLAVGTAACWSMSAFGRVGAPSASNNRNFAGVLGTTATVGNTGEARAQLYGPGSICRVYVIEANATVGKIATMIVGGTNAGKFTTSVNPLGGRGCVRLLETCSGAGLVKAEILDGKESGGVEFVTPTSAGGAISIMTGGITVFPTAVTLAANATFTLADGDTDGMRKVFLCKAAMTTNKIVITVTNGLQAALATALATISFNTAGTAAELEFLCGSKWVERFCTATKA